MKFKKIANEYIEFISFKGKPQSIRSVKSRINNYLLPYFYNYNIEDITPIMYLKWQEDINKLNFSFAYMKSLHYTMVSIINYYIKFYDYNKNIASKVGNFKNNYNQRTYKIWDYNEFNKFINVVDNIVYKTLFEFMYYTGCRLGECLALNFYDLEDNKININKTISKEFINGKR